jgi:hypothetical protein
LVEQNTNWPLKIGGAATPALNPKDISDQYLLYAARSVATLVYDNDLGITSSTDKFLCRF